MPKSQITSPKTLQIHSISPKWSALWAHPSPTPPMWRQQQGLRGLPPCPWVTEPGRTSETTHRTTRQQPAPPAWRAPEGPEGQTAVPVGGGRAWPCFETTRRSASITTTPQVWGAPEGLAAVPVGGGRAWPGFETTRRAKLAARTASGRAAAHGHTKQTGTNRCSSRQPEIWRHVTQKVVAPRKTWGPPLMRSLS